MSVKEFVLSDAQWQEIQQRKKKSYDEVNATKKNTFCSTGVPKNYKLDKAYLPGISTKKNH